MIYCVEDDASIRELTVYARMPLGFRRWAWSAPRRCGSS